MAKFSAAHGRWIVCRRRWERLGSRTNPETASRRLRRWILAALADSLASGEALEELVAKLAMVRAISASPEKPVITGDDVRWAAKFVMHVTKEMLHEAQFHVAEGKFDALMKRALAFLEKKGGAADRSMLLRHLHTDAVTLKKLVSTMLLSELIEDEVVTGGKVVYSLRNAA